MSVGRVLVYGGKGALGAACVSHFKNNNYWVGSIDLSENDQADVSIVVPRDGSWADQEQEVINKVSDALQGNKLDAVICVAGGWAGGNAKKGMLNRVNRKWRIRAFEIGPKRPDTYRYQYDLCKIKKMRHYAPQMEQDILEPIGRAFRGHNEFGNKDLAKNADLMWRQSVWTSTISAAVAAHHLKDGGILALTGAKPALEGTPGMIGYGMAKAAVHQLTRSLAGKDSGLPNDAMVVSILPVTLDTPMNRKWMPKADFTTWTPLTEVAELFHKWTKGEERPTSGALLQLITKDSVTQLVESN